MMILRRTIHAAAIVLNAVQVLFIGMNLSQSRTADLMRFFTTPGGPLALSWTLAPIFSLIVLVWTWREPEPEVVS